MIQSEAQLEQQFLEKLVELKYTYRSEMYSRRQRTYARSRPLLATTAPHLTIAS